MRRKCENHLAIGRGFCYYEKAVLADNREGGASTNGKMSVLRQGLELRHQSEPLSPPLEPHLETQCEARQGHRGRQTPARLRMHPLPPQRQGHPRCVNCNDCTEQGSPDWASLFRILGHLPRTPRLLLTKRMAHHPKSVCAAGGPRGQGPPRMRCLHRRKAMPSPCRENGLMSKPFVSQGSPRGQGPPRMRSCIAFGNAFSSRSEWRTIPRASEPQGSPRGQGPPRMRSCIAFGNAFSSRSEWRTIPRASEPQGSPRGQGPPRMRSCIAFGNAPVTPPAPPRRGSHRGSTCRSAAAGNTKRSARSHRST